MTRARSRLPHSTKHQAPPPAGDKPSVPMKFRDHIPYYYQLKEALRGQLLNGVFRVGERIPPELELLKRYSVSRPTVRRALAELVQEGYLERFRGRGTFVARPAVTPDARVVSTFAAEVEQSGRKHRVRLLNAVRLAATGVIARDLRISEHEPVFQVTRLRLGNTEPLILEIAMVPVAICPELLEAANLEQEGIYAALERLRDVRIGRAEQTFQAIAAPADVARLLGIKVGTPVLLWEGIAYSTLHQPVERARVYYRGDRYRFSVQQHRVAGMVLWSELPPGGFHTEIGVDAMRT